MDLRLGSPRSNGTPRYEVSRELRRDGIKESVKKQIRFGSRLLQSDLRLLAADGKAH